MVRPANGVLSHGANLDRVASATVPKQEQTNAGVIKVEIEIACGECGIRFEGECVHPVNVARLVSVSVVCYLLLYGIGPCPEIESELTGPEVPVVARRNRDTVILTIRSE